MALRHVNAVVVGAGAGGGVVAKELSEAGLSVVMLERGGWVSFEEHGQDELINQRTTVLGNAYGPDDRSPRVVETGPGTWETVLPNEGGYSNNAACVGGGHRQLRRHGLALHAEGFPDALDLRRARGFHARGLADQLRRP